MKDRKHRDFIIQAVNSHYELIEACEDCINFIDSKGMFKDEYYPDWYVKMEQALAKAKGEA